MSKALQREGVLYFLVLFGMGFSNIFFGTHVHVPRQLSVFLISYWEL